MAALTWWSHCTRLSGGLALMWHSKYTSSPSLMFLGLRAGARRACTSGATVSKKKLGRSDLSVVRPRVNEQHHLKCRAAVYPRPPTSQSREAL
ncbi:hypothetical protein E2C01_076006 [Portunus trituberculatus]|uniref:Secreted protein n=1 Tax=Portunus trituberculatus TaxID=210409 RepID=A0A5B7IC39_PORTR|nr:hypothetical protein [Portunus trituberculatus]